MTTGVLLRILISKKTLAGYTHIIIDEVHERDIETDMLLLTIKYLMRRGTTTRIVLMSATLDTNEYSEYFHMVFGGDRGNQSTRGNAGDDATSTGYDVNQDYPEYQSSVGLININSRPFHINTITLS